MTSASVATRPLRIGIVNLMPRAETSESTLLAALQPVAREFEAIWLRLETPSYASSDRAHIDRVYLPLSTVLAHEVLDGLIISGAPVEDLPFESVTYWHELSPLLRLARQCVPSTLGLCWGALALAQQLGIDKQTFSRKLFGVYQLDTVAPEHPIVRELGPKFPCPQSRYSGFDPESLAAAVAAGRVRVIARSDEAGAVILESADRRFLMHVGHPEYEASRLLLEYRRDRATDRTDVGPPHGYDLECPHASWRASSTGFFRAWFDTLRG